MQFLFSVVEACFTHKCTASHLTIPIKILLCVKVLRGVILGKTDTKTGMQ